MTTKKALKLLKDILDEATTDENAVCYVTNHDEIPLRLAIKALEKQIPKKPKIVEVDMDGMDMETGDIYTYKIDEAHCSACDYVIGNEYNFFDDCHCSKCGQKINWSCW